MDAAPRAGGLARPEGPLRSRPQVHELIETSLAVEGMPRNASTHAAGVVITREAATEYVPLGSNNGVPVTQFNMTEIERLGPA